MTLLDLLQSVFDPVAPDRKRHCDRHDWADDLEEWEAPEEEEDDGDAAV